MGFHVKQQAVRNSWTNVQAENKIRSKFRAAELKKKRGRWGWRKCGSDLRCLAPKSPWHEKLRSDWYQALPAPL